MENNRGSWGSNIGFLLAAIGSAVGLGNIWGFPYKMGKSGGFTFLLVYLLLAIFVGVIIMLSELAVGRKTKLNPVQAYKKLCKKFAWIGWLALGSAFILLTFYVVLGGYVLQYLALNLADLSFNLGEIFGQPITGGATFGAMLTNPFGCVIFTAFVMIICMVIVQGGVSSGIEKFNKIGMPALFIMLLIIIIRSLTLPHAIEGLKFIFVPGYAVKAGFITEAPGLISVLATAGGQMFFSLSLAMGAILVYGSYLEKDANLVSNSVIIVISDTLIALLAGIAVIPAAVANGIANGMAVGDISLGGPKLLFITLQDVFSNMGKIGPLFGVIFYALVLIAAVSSAISVMEAVASYWIDKDLAKGETDTRSRITLIVALLLLLFNILVAWDGLGSNGIEPARLIGVPQGDAPAFMQDWLDFFDCLSEGLCMPFGALLMSLMIGWEKSPDLVLDEAAIGGNVSSFLKTFYTICIRFIVPIVMAFVLAGQMIDFFGGSSMLWYVVAFLLLVVFWIFAAVGNKKEVSAAE